MTPLSMRPPAVPGAVARRRRALLIGGALGAAAMLMMQPKSARAQAFEATPTPALNAGTFNRVTGSGTETITINPSGSGVATAVINWNLNTPTSVFLPDGRIATFEGPANFAVLNRIFGPLPGGGNVLAEFQGTVLSQVAGGAPGQRGGTIIFSSPGGILATGNALFDVGNLVLTTLDVAYTPGESTGAFFDPFDLNFSLLNAASATSGVEIQSGVTINALNNGSYVAMVAPSIVQRGTVRADGSVAYVAAEGARLTINNGLFDIVIRDGTTDDTGIDHSGQTGGPAAGSGENQVIYFVAVPKNQAITALLSGAIGYDPATTVGVENGVIILSAGYGDIDDTTVDTSAPSTGAASFRINEGAGADSVITSDLFGYAVTDATARTTSTFDVRFEQDATLIARQRASLEANAGGEIVVGGDAVIDASRVDSDTVGVYDVVGGTALVQADGTGSVLITGNLDVLADGRGAIGSGGPGSGTGGTAGVAADSGLVQVGGNLEVSARGYGADSVYASEAAGAGAGGSALVEARNGSSISVTGSVAAFATGEGGYAYGGYYGAGAGTGGSAEVVADASTVQSGGSLTVDARGRGGGLVYSDATAGAGTGGSAGVAALDGGSVAATGDILAYASGLGGAVGNGAGTTGAGNGGSVVISSTSTTPSASVIQSGGLFADASGSAGITTYDEAAVADGTGGSIGIDVGPASSIAITGYASLNAVGNGGAFFGPPGYSYYGVDGGAGSGGSVTIGLADGASLTVTAATNINAGGFGGDGNDAVFAGAGGAGNGGQVDITLDQGSFASLGDLRISAYGAGGYGGAGLENDSGTASPGADGGQGIGGDVTIALQDFSTLVATSLGDSETRGIDVRGVGGAGGGGSAGDDGGGNGGFGALGDAGTVVITSGVGSAVTVNGAVYIDAAGEGGYGGDGGYTGGDFGPGGDGGDGGDGVAGSVVISGVGGSLASTALSVDVGGIGGQGGEAGYSPQFFGPPEQPGYSGNGAGGTIAISVTDADGESGAGSFGFTNLRASAYSGYSQTNYDIAGSILIEDLGTVDAGLEFATLTAAVTGTPGNAAAAFEFSGDTGPTTVDFGVNVIVSGQANFNAAGSGGLVSGTVASSGPSSFYVNANNIQVFHDSPTAGASTIAGENVSLVALNVITGSPDSLINATNGDASLLANLIEVGRIRATGDIDMLSGASTILVRADAGDDFSATAGTSFAGGTVTAEVGSDITISATDDLRLDDATASGTISLLSQAGSVLSDGTLTADQLLVSAALNIDLNDVFVVQDLSLTTDAGFIDGNSFNGDGDINLDSSQDITLAAADAGGDFNALAYGGADLGTVTATGNMFVSASTVTLDAGSAGGFAVLYADGNVDAGTVNSGATLYVSAEGVAIDAATATESVVVDAGGDATLGDVDAGVDIRVEADSISLADGTAGRDITLTANGDIDVGTAQAGDDFRAFATGAFTGGTVVTTGLGPDEDACIDCSFPSTPTPGEGSNIVVEAFNNVRLDNGQSPDLIDLTSVAGSILSDGTLRADALIADANFDIALNDVFVVQDLTLVTDNGDISGNSFNSDGDIDLDSAGTVVLADASAGGNITVYADGDLRLDNGDAGGAIDLTSLNGNVLSDGTLTASQLFASSAQNIALNDVFVTSSLTLTTSNGDISGNSFNSDDDITLVSAGAIQLADANAPGDLDFTSAADLRLDDAAAENIELTSTAGSVLSAGLLQTVNSVRVTAAQDADLNAISAGGSIILRADGDLAAGDLDAVLPVAAYAGGGVVIASMTSDQSLFVQAGGDVDLGSADAGTDLDVDGAEVVIGDAVAGGAIRLFASGDLTVDTAQAAQGLLADAGGSFAADQLTVTGSGGDIQVGADDIFVDRAVSAGGIRLQAGDGDIEVAGLLQAEGTIDAIAAGAFTMQGDATIDAGDLIVEAGSTTLNRVDAGSVDILVDALAAFEGAVNAGTIFVGSGDIDIQAGGALGASATNLVILQTLGGGQAVLGGTAQGPAYTLTNVEFGRISASQLRFSAQGSGSAAPNLLIRDLAIQGRGLANGRIGDLEVSTQGFARVEGNVAFTGARADDQFDLRANQRLEVLTPNGRLVMTDAAGALGGLLQLFSDDIVVASPTLAAQLLADPALPNRVDLLRTNDGPVEPNGYIRANSVTLFVGSTLFVQNSGVTPTEATVITDLGGITVGTGSLVIDEFQPVLPESVTPQAAPQALPLDVIAFGRRVNPDGSVVQGDDFFAEVDFSKDDGVTYLDTAEFNTCLINAGCPIRFRPDPPSSDVIEQPVDVVVVDFPETELVDASFATEALIEEPVTSGADSILWDCDRDDDGDCDEDDVDG